MTTYQQVKDQMKNKLTEWKADIEEMELHLNLGKKEALEHFEKQKAAMQKRVEQLKKRAGELEMKGKQNATDLKAQLEELQLQLALGKAESAEAFRKQRQKIDQQLQSLEKTLSKSREIGSEQYQEFSDRTAVMITNFRTNLEILRMQIALGKAQLKSGNEKRKKKIKKQVQDMKQLLHKTKETSQVRMGVFSQEMKEAGQHIREGVKAILQ